MFQQLLIASLVGLALSAPSNRDKVDVQLKNVLSRQGRANVVVSFDQGTDAVLNRINSMRFDSRGAKITAMKSQLEELRDLSQESALRLLSSRSTKSHSLWINNRIYIEDATPELVSAIAFLPEVAEIREEIVIQLEKYVEHDSDISAYAEWGITKIEAEEAWALPGGNNGAGVVVASIDTGVRHTHTALRNNFRSPYGWYEPDWTPEYPRDTMGHGTHVMGTIVGAGGIGVAPGAQWIACNACNLWGCTERVLSLCGQWVTCPTLSDGKSSPDCSKAPQISSNSWGGGGGQTFYNSIIDAWHAAGIIPVFANGNAGPECGTVNSPGDNPNVIGVGATNHTDTISVFSSRGPSVNGTLKPDVSAPGENIRSAWWRTDTAYNTISGTSMATPHAAGAIAILLSRNPDLTFTQIKDLLQDNTDRGLPEVASCDAHPPTVYPNNVYGFGRINIRKALSAAINDV